MQVLSSRRVYFGAVPDPKISPPAAAVEKNKPAEKKPNYSYTNPTPSRLVMRLTNPLIKAFMLTGIPYLREIPLVKDIPLVKGYTHATLIDSDEALEVLKQSVNQNTAAFIGINHPEFIDFMLDKYVADKVSPYAAIWAAQSVVNNPLKKLFLKNNVIGNNGKEAAKQYSVDWALQGGAVILHPEGVVRWTSNKIHAPLPPGIVDMSIMAAKKSLDEKLGKPVYIAPIVWKLRFTKDVGTKLQQEMSKIGQKLGLPKATGKPTLVEHFYHLQTNLLASQMKKLGYAEPFELQGKSYFDRTEAFLNTLFKDVRARYEIKDTGILEQKLRRLEYTIYALQGDQENSAEMKKQLKADLAKVIEMKRLNWFSREVYGGQTLSQEDVAESLKLIRMLLVHNTLWDKVEAYALPKPAGQRMAHIRPIPPIDVTERLSEARKSGLSEDDLTDKLLEEMYQRMQKRLDDLNLEIEPLVAPFRQPNLFLATPKFY